MIKLLLILVLSILPCTSYSTLLNNVDIKNFYNAEQGKALPDVPFYNKQGEKLILDQFDGKIVILNFWATWCTNCAKEIKLLDELQKKSMKLPIKIIPVSIDFKDIETIEQCYEKNHIKYLGVYRDEKRTLYNEFASHGVPLTVIINERGEIIGYFKGNVNWEREEIRNWIISLTENIKFEYKDDKDSQEILQKKIE